MIKDREQLLGNAWVGWGSSFWRRNYIVGRDWVEFLYVPIQNLGPSNEARSQTKSSKSRRDLRIWVTNSWSFFLRDFVDAECLCVLREDSTNTRRRSTETEKQSNHRKSLEGDAVGGSLENYVHVLLFCWISNLQVQLGTGHWARWHCSVTQWPFWPTFRHL